MAHLAAKIQRSEQKAKKKTAFLFPSPFEKQLLLTITTINHYNNYPPSNKKSEIPSRISRL